MVPTINLDQPIDITQALHAMHLNDGLDSNLYMDTYATSHLASYTSKLQSLGTKINLTHVFVGNGLPISVTHTGQTIFPSIHQRLGHPIAHVFNRLISSHFIDCNKVQNIISFQAFQLGKNVCLPFSSSNTSFLVYLI